ncbi:MAG: Peptidase [Pedosphaera sp.]|nr:Peptidase [Pedosphaera sp.]
MADHENTQTLRHKIRSSFWLRFVIVLALLLPVMVLLLMPGGPLLAGVIWFWMLALLSFWVIWLVLGRAGRKARAAVQPEEHVLNFQPEPIREVMDVKVAVEESGVQVFRGRLLEPASVAYQKLKQALGGQAVPLIQEDDQFGAAILVMPKQIEKAVLERRSRPWVNWLLFFLTLLTTTWAGAAQAGVNLLQEPGRFVVGLPYALGLLTILGVHELGHFFAARHHGMDVTPPYFIPVPFALGTFGAFIKMRSPAEDRWSLFDVAVAGPLAGLAIAIPALLIGLHSSVVLPGSMEIAREPLNGGSAGSSILFALLAKISLGPALLQGSTLRLSPLAYAGWLGLVITALNLLPIGQLDGGHTVRAMFGTRIGRVISNVAMWTLFLLALFVWPGLMMWAIIVFFIAGRSSPPLNDLTPITRGRFWLGWLTFAILALILIPLPQSWWNALGIYHP